MNYKLLFCLIIVASSLNAQDNSTQTADTTLRNSCRHKELLEAFICQESALLAADKKQRFSYTVYDQKLNSYLNKICIGSFPTFLIGSYCYLAMQKKESGESIDDKRKYDALNSLVSAVLGTTFTVLIGTATVDVIKRSSYLARFMLDQKIMAQENMLTRLKQNVLKEDKSDEQ